MTEVDFFSVIESIFVMALLLGLPLIGIDANIYGESDD